MSSSTRTIAPTPDVVVAKRPEELVGQRQFAHEVTGHALVGGGVDGERHEPHQRLIVAHAAGCGAQRRSADARGAPSRGHAGLSGDRGGTQPADLKALILMTTVVR